MTDELDTWGRHLLKSVQYPDESVTFHLNYYVFLRELITLLNSNQHAVIIVTGDQGKGKSTFALVSSLILRMGGLRFDWGNISYSINEVPGMVEMATAGELAAYTIDEAIDAADSRRYMSKLSVHLTSIFTRIRKKRNIYFWCIPDFADIDPRLRNRIADFWVHVYWRSHHEDRDRRYAKAFLFARNKNFFNPDRWGLVDMPKYAIHSNDRLEQFARRNRCYRGRMAFPIMPLAIEDKYAVKSHEALAEAGREFKKAYQKPQSEETATA